jgi:L-serine deaminase
MIKSQSANAAVARQPLAFPDEANAHPEATLRQIARGNETVAAIVTGACHDHDATPLQHLGGSVGNGTAGILH